MLKRLRELEQRVAALEAANQRPRQHPLSRHNAAKAAQVARLRHEIGQIVARSAEPARLTAKQVRKQLGVPTSGWPSERTVREYLAAIRCDGAGSTSVPPPKRLSRGAS